MFPSWFLFHVLLNPDNRYKIEKLFVSSCHLSIPQFSFCFKAFFVDKSFLITHYLLLCPEAFLVRLHASNDSKVLQLSADRICGPISDLLSCAMLFLRLEASISFVPKTEKRELEMRISSFLQVRAVLEGTFTWTQRITTEDHYSEYCSRNYLMKLA